LRGHSLTTSIINFAPKRNNAIRTVRVDAVVIINFSPRRATFYAVFLVGDRTHLVLPTPPKTNIVLYSVRRTPDRPTLDIAL
jgi:hypothetical protein